MGGGLKYKNLYYASSDSAIPKTFSRSGFHCLGRRQLRINRLPYHKFTQLLQPLALLAEPRTTRLFSCGEDELLQALEKLCFSQIAEALKDTGALCASASFRADDMKYSSEMRQATV